MRNEDLYPKSLLQDLDSALTNVDNIHTGKNMKEMS